MRYMNEAVDKVRKKENKHLMAKDKTLIEIKYLWLKAKINFTEKNKPDFRKLNIDQLSVVGRIWNRKELLRYLWDYTYELPVQTFSKSGILSNSLTT